MSCQIRLRRKASYEIGTIKRPRLRLRLRLLYTLVLYCTYHGELLVPSNRSEEEAGDRGQRDEPVGKPEFGGDSMRDEGIVVEAAEGRRV